MSSLRSWIRGGSSTGGSTSSTPKSKLSASSTPNGSASQVADPREVEISDLQDAMDAAGMIMNDDIEGAEVRLSARKNSSSFHLLGLGVSTFMRSVLGFEKEIMTQASTRLADCETRALSDMKKAQKSAEGGSGWFGGRGASSGGHVAGNASQIYPPGSEFQLVHAEAQMMNAVVGVMHESLTEGIKGFYKLRKAFIALDAIMAAEERALGGPNGVNGAARRPQLEQMPGSFDESEFADENPEMNTKTKSPEDDSDLDFVDAAEKQSGTQTPSSYGGHLAKTETESTPTSQASASSIDKKLADVKLADSTSASSVTLDSEATSESRPSVSTIRSLPNHAAFNGGPDVSHFTNPIDVFVHSGVNMCFGILLLLISMIPPAFSRLMYIVGFKGDRERGVRMLWQATKFNNINGAVAGLALLGYYHGIFAYADILPADDDIAELADQAVPGGEIIGYPRDRCSALLASMRQQYPDSRLWKVEQARMLANTRNLPDAVAMLVANGDAKMRQVTAMNNFELALNSLFMQDWPRMRDAFLRAIELNDWSHSIYYYIAASAELEMYRDAVHAARRAEDEKERGVLETEARRHKEEAETHFRKVPASAGRKRFMARQMPMEVFVLRKVAKWEERAKALDVDLVDAVGHSPALEMTWLWNGARRMGPELVESALTFSAWERCTGSAEVLDKIKAEKDEVTVKAVCDASLLRQLGRLEEARAVLKEVMVFEKHYFKGPGRDDYALPAVYYELGVIAWIEACERSLWPKDSEGVEGFRLKKVNECQSYLDQVSKWETFVLDGRIGMRIQTGVETVKWLKKKKNWA